MLTVRSEIGSYRRPITALSVLLTRVFSAPASRFPGGLQRATFSQFAEFCEKVRLIPIEIRLERALYRKPEVFRLLNGQLCQLDSKLAQMKTRDLLV